MLEEEWGEFEGKLVSRRIVITRPEISGKQIGALKLRTNFGVNVTRVNRAGVDLIASPNLELNIGDRVTVVGSEMALQDVSRMLGNSLKRLREPNLVTMFFGILLGLVGISFVLNLMFSNPSSPIMDSVRNLEDVPAVSAGVDPRGEILNEMVQMAENLKELDKKIEGYMQKDSLDLKSLLMQADALSSLLNGRNGRLNQDSVSINKQIE